MISTSDSTITQPPPRPAAPEAPAPAPPARQRKAARQRVRFLKWAVGALAGTAAVIWLIRAWTPDPVAVDLATVDRGPLTVTVDEDGRTRVRDRFVVSAPIAGTLIRPELRVGDSVRQGQVIARLAPVASQLLDPRSRLEAQARVTATEAAVQRAIAAVSQARDARDFARREAERQRSLYQAGATSQRDWEQADLLARARESDLASARQAQRMTEAERRQARAVLLQYQSPASASTNRFEVPAPTSGRILRLETESESVLPAGTPLFEIGNPALLEVVIDVLSADAVNITPGARVRIEQWGRDSALQAHVRRVEPSAFTRLSALGVEEQRVNVLIDLDDPPAVWSTLGDGFRVEARIEVWHADDVVRVPGGAVFRHGDGWAVYAVRDGVARLTPIGIGQRTGTLTRVISGLEPGDTVVAYPGDTVEDGKRVISR